MTSSYEYDNSYEPAAPAVVIGLSPSGGDVPRQQLVALVDSGADASMLPTDVLTAAGARIIEQRQMRGVVGSAVTVNLYLTAVHIGNHTIHGIRAVGIAAGGEAIIGRDVLNQLEIILNGPAQEMMIH